MASNDEPDKKKDPFLEWLEETDDLFGLEEEIETITFICIECKKEDEVPDFVVDEFDMQLEYQKN
ncbi:hypothetical protein [Alkalihalobacillus deserti]|uniref:hypothetical protein n=1 Tax=Alkalihalobacillus deserti TaxID=2879466 RepID=UPI001D151268|nr:hypothetical protein [Alkalihalobacillus deserti]